MKILPQTSIWRGIYTMQDIQRKMNSWISLSKLTNATGVEFERYAQFFMLLVDTRYHVTRAKKDNGIDGYIYLDSSSPFIKNIQYFSIYGPEPITSWKSKKQKLINDLKAVIDDASLTNSKIVKWSILINFEMTKNQYEEISNICNEKGIIHEVLHPKKIISKLESVEQIHKAAAFVDGIPLLERKLTDYHYHVFAEKALKLLIKYEDDEISTTEREELLMSLRKDIIFYIPKEVSLDLQGRKLFRYNREVKLINLLNIINEHTGLHDSESIWIHQYSTKTKDLHTYTLEEAEKLNLPVDILNVRNVCSDNNNPKGYYYILVEDLSILAYLMNLLLKQNRLQGKYSVEKALYDLSLIHYTYLPGFRKKYTSYRLNRTSVSTTIPEQSALEGKKQA